MPWPRSHDEYGVLERQVSIRGSITPLGPLAARRPSAMPRRPRRKAETLNSLTVSGCWEEEVSPRGPMPRGTGLTGPVTYILVHTYLLLCRCAAIATPRSTLSLLGCGAMGGYPMSPSHPPKTWLGNCLLPGTSRRRAVQRRTRRSIGL